MCPSLLSDALVTKPILNYPGDNLKKIYDFRAYENRTLGRCIIACQQVFYKWNDEQEFANGVVEAEKERAYH